MEVESNLSMDNSFESIECDDFKVDFSHLIEDEEPKKKSRAGPGSMIPNISSIDTPNLSLHDNSVTNDLFQVTRGAPSMSNSSTMLASSPPRKKKKNKHFDIFNQSYDVFDDFSDQADDDVFNSSSRLSNNKIDKLVQELSEDGFELDDQVRTRIYKGRFRGGEYNEVDSYLDDNKENLPYPDPLKSVRHKENNSIRKNNVNMIPKRKNVLSSAKSFIPTLRPLSNLSTNVTNFELRNDYVKEFNKNSNTATTTNNYNNNNTNNATSVSMSPKRICVPNHLNYTGKFKPSIKYSKSSTNIYMVDSSTGSINDATQFGTELNASNCEGFPLPEDTNEIVQIPTNDDTNKNKQKMAIIKAYHNKYFNTASSAASSRESKPDFRIGGFYSSEEFEKFQSSIDAMKTGVELVQNEPKTKAKNKKGKARVNWAEQLEW
ncbi:hypothetical protein CLIB1423_05S05798 [[Candida] railenensis]|uniref:Uncharacterized protein n=1 Tax=[Candida] railenensis TaxID=45579 RepID=A0A9P0QNQ2_9ASCO|nr:hypothetical protein CLIB1423_05S05798 [[Candida] railenensis]